MAVIAGAKKGFAFSAANLISLLVCGGMAYLVCNVVAMPAYNSFVKEKNISTSKKIVEEYVPNERLRQLISSSKNEAEINEYIDRLKSQDIDLREEFLLQIANVSDRIDNAIGSDGNGNRDGNGNSNGNSRISATLNSPIFDKIIPEEKFAKTAIVLITEPPEVAANYIEANYLRPPAVTVIKIIVFFIAFVLMSILFGFLVKIFIRKIPVLKSADTLLGAIFGILYGFVCVALMCLVFKFAIYMSEDTLPFVNTNNILNSKLLSIIYRMFI
jgi:hypothetical protein